MKKLTIIRDKKKYNKKFYDMKIVKYFDTPFEASEYLFRYINEIGLIYLGFLGLIQLFLVLQFP